jgi:hypothetical protein
LEVGGDGAILASTGTSEFGPGCSTAVEISFLTSETGVVKGLMGWARDDSDDPFVKARLVLSSIGDSATLGKTAVGPELVPDISEDVRDCPGPSLCKLVGLW